MLHASDASIIKSKLLNFFFLLTLFIHLKSVFKKKKTLFVLVIWKKKAKAITVRRLKANLKNLIFYQKKKNDFCEISAMHFAKISNSILLFAMKCIFHAEVLNCNVLYKYLCH